MSYSFAKLELYHLIFQTNYYYLWQTVLVYPSTTAYHVNDLSPVHNIIK